MKCVLLAAGKSSRMFRTLKKPKCLLKIENKTLIEKLILNLRGLKIKKIYIVVGFKSHLIKKSLNHLKFLNFIHNNNYGKKEMLYSMILALKKIDDDIIFSYSDITYDKIIMKKLVNKRNNIYLPILSQWQKVWKKRKKNILGDAEDLKIDKRSNLIHIGGKIKNIKKVKYQFMGIVFIPKKIRKKIIELYETLKNNDKMHLTSFLNFLIKKNINIKCLKYHNNWYEFDDMDDYLNYIKNI